MRINLFEKIFGKKIKDERVTELNRRVASEGYWVFFYGLLALMLVKIFVLHRPSSEWGSEWMLFMLGAIYSCVRSTMLGVPLSIRKMKIEVKLLSALSCMFGFWIITIGLSVLGGNLYAGSYLPWLVAGAAAGVATYILLFLMEKLSDRRVKKLSGSDPEQPPD